MQNQPAARQVTVKRYDKEQHYISDAPAMAAEGWQVVTSCSFQPRSGWARIVFSLGWLAMVYPPKPQIVVTYAR